MNKIISALLFALVFTVTVNGQEKQKDTSVSTYYLIRHAEKVISENPNPELDSIGKLRALQWAEIFEDISFDAVYSTDYIRTRNTVLPTTKSKGLNLILYHPRDINYKKFKSETKGKTILIVGHSNTIPKFVNELIGVEKYKDIEHDNNGNLYIVEIYKNSISEKLLHLN
jgi:broad specificity phosphatase PhoE